MNIFILGHILADFVFQKDCDVEKKKNGVIRGNLKHIIKVSILYIISAVYFVIVAGIRNIGSISLVILFIIVNIAFHFVFDLAKSKLQSKLTNMNLLLLFVDQMLHIIILFLSFNLFLKDYINIDYQGDNYIILLIFLFISTFVSSVVVREILDLFHLDTNIGTLNQNVKMDEKDADHKLERAVGNDSKNDIFLTDDSEKLIEEIKNNGVKIGKWIGIIERTIMFLSIYFNILGLLTIVVAFKTLTRYENIKKNPEYYIIGNLLSILLVLVSYGIFEAITY
ncbi:MAG: DUF3307 domain-containing protein [Acholeplasmataceae bacterium]|jgi:hypothetical protein|nr:DUF3307 domain-containing protein [Acholeplasmataceae bacterium]